ncbi:MAG: hypothetical protein ABJE47_01775 [bacterium]
MVGVPIIVLGAMALLLMFDERPTAAPEQHIAVRSVHGGTATTLIYGAGTGIHLRRVSGTGTPIVADLSHGALHVLSLESMQVEAAEIAGVHATMRGRGHSVTLRSEGEGVRIKAWF